MVRDKLIKVLRSWRTWVIGVPLIAGFFLLSRSIDIEAVHDQAARLNSVVAFVLLTILPLIGFPVSVLHVTAGIRFGVGLGFGLVALSILLQLLASYGLVHWRRKYFARKFKDVRDKIPPGAHGAVTLFTLLLPGVPYFAKNYVLPVAGVPLRTYLLWCFPIHVARSSVAVIFGDESDHLTPTRIAVMACYAAAVLTASWWAYRRMQAQIADQPPAAGGPKKRG
jgi:uncharacterized membrane protein YdjX (TVP38/TMEM64 family)